mmetsp:Transcript_16163/g.23453  ORF Transcript_16163/g.23453 Transcript_16163/m.23453 type:complete len:83 (+) Transcript_16163:1705-1953(+)
MCPDSQCPANCSGQGVCDHKEGKPKCVCNDSTDTTDGCFQSFSMVPPNAAHKAPAGWGQHSDATKKSGAIVAILALLVCFVL